MAAGDIVVGPDGERIVLVDVGQTVLLDNEAVRVWEVDLAPEGRQPWHLHHNPYVVLCLAASPGRMDWLDGSPPRYVKEYVGGAVMRPVSPVHRLTNIGESRYRNRLVELKDLGDERPPTSTAIRPGDDLNAESRSAQSSGGDAWEVVLESPYLTVSTVAVAPGEALELEPSSYPRVIVPLAPADDDPTGGIGFVTAGSGARIAAGTVDEPRSYVVQLTYLGTGDAP